MAHTLIALGTIGCMNVYIDVPLKEALKRFLDSEEGAPLVNKFPPADKMTDNDWNSMAQYLKGRGDLRTFEFEDEFEAYDVWKR